RHTGESLHNSLQSSRPDDALHPLHLHQLLHSPYILLKIDFPLYWNTTGDHSMPSTAYPTFWTACFMASRSALGAMMMTAVPFSWSAVASSTPGIASKAVFTVFSQWPHIMPSIFMVFSTVVSWTCS